MLRKTLTYDGFDGPITEDWYFHLNEAELTKMQLEHGEGLEEHLKTLVKNNDARAIIEAFENIIRMTVGRRVSTPAGDRFVKSKEISDEFMGGEAYSSLFMELAGSPTAASEFIRGIMTSKIQQKIDEQTEEQNKLSGLAAAALASDNVRQNKTTSDLAIEVRESSLKKSTAEQIRNIPSWIKEGREPTRVEILSMTPEELLEFQRNAFSR